MILQIVRKLWLCVFLVSVFAPLSAQTTQKKSATALSNIDKSNIRVNILQINDVYEITPVGGYGGVARFATLKKQLIRETPNTFSIMAGDFFSPSALGTAKVNGERLAGKQMVAALNAAGLDYATFGNHEFDLKEEQFKARMTETKFKWVSSNVFDGGKNPMPNVFPSTIVKYGNRFGRQMQIGIIGVTLDKNKPNYVSFTNFLQAAKNQIADLKSQVDMIVAITHLELADDIRLAEECPEIDLIMGGHEHENILVRRGTGLTPITKADANAKTAYIHRIFYNTVTKRLDIESQLRVVSSSIPEDPSTAIEVAKWIEAAYAGFRAEGFEPTKLVTQTTEALDGREVTVRNQPCLLGKRIAEGMEGVVPNAKAGLFNGGSIRIDDVVAPGPITEYDVIRVLPFGGEVVEATMKGRLLKKVLEQGLKNRGNGGYLQYTKITQEGGVWKLAGAEIMDEADYVIATSDFLVSGKETGLDYLKEGNPDLKMGGKFGDVRKAFIKQLQKVYPNN